MIVENDPPWPPSWEPFRVHAPEAPLRFSDAVPRVTFAEATRRRQRLAYHGALRRALAGKRARRHRGASE